MAARMAARSLAAPRASGAMRPTLACSIQPSSWEAAFGPDHDLEPAHQAPGISQAGHSRLDGSDDHGVGLGEMITSISAMIVDLRAPSQGRTSIQTLMPWLCE